MTVYEQNNQKGIVVAFTAVLSVIPFLISGLQLNHVVVDPPGHPSCRHHYCCPCRPPPHPAMQASIKESEVVVVVVVIVVVVVVVVVVVC